MMFAWVFFNAKSFVDALAMIKSIFVVPHANQVIDVFMSEFIGGHYKEKIVFVLICVLLIIIADLIHENNQSLRMIVCKRAYPIRLVFYLVLVFSIIIFGAYGNHYSESNFIYLIF